MNILAEAESNAAISILHAAGLNKGCSVGINLKANVKLVSEPQEIKHDYHQLFQSIEMVWKEYGLPLPDVYGWLVSSEIPIGQGLKSSSAISCAAIKALNKATWAGLSDSEIVDIAVSSQRKSGCTITGSMDDTWASISNGWKLVNPRKSAEESIILEGKIELEMIIFLILRGKRSGEINISNFKQQSSIFERALDSISNNSVFQAISTNGLAVAAAIGDDEAVRICNKLIAIGAIAAGITGSGPAISIVSYVNDSEIIRESLSDLGYEIIETTFIDNNLLELI
jgi:shikimate kinase